jgi:hypothetical protein
MDDEMDMTCGMHGRDDVCIQFWLKSLKVSDYLEDIGIDGRIILKCILEK